MKELVFSFSGIIKTDFFGINQIASFYNFCNAYENCNIKINFDNVLFFDANLSALLVGLSKKLKSERGITFSSDENFEHSFLCVKKHSYCNR